MHRLYGVVNIPSYLLALGNALIIIFVTSSCILVWVEGYVNFYSLFICLLNIAQSGMIDLLHY
jgi:hypothetical protein